MPGAQSGANPAEREEFEERSRAVWRQEQADVRSERVLRQNELAKQVENEVAQLTEMVFCYFVSGLRPLFEDFFSGGGTALVTQRVSVMFITRRLLQYLVQLCSQFLDIGQFSDVPGGGSDRIRLAPYPQFPAIEKELVNILYFECRDMGATIQKLLALSADAEASGQGSSTGAVTPPGPTNCRGSEPAASSTAGAASSSASGTQDAQTQTQSRAPGSPDSAIDGFAVISLQEADGVSGSSPERTAGAAAAAAAAAPAGAEKRASVGAESSDGGEKRVPSSVGTFASAFGATPEKQCAGATGGKSERGRSVDLADAAAFPALADADGWEVDYVFFSASVCESVRANYL